MKQTSQSGVTALQVIIALTLVAVAFGLIATLTSSSDEQEVAGANSPEAQQNTPIETVTQNKAADIAAPVTDAVAKKNQEIQAEMEVTTAPEADTTAALPAAVAPTEPEPTTVATAGVFTDYSPAALSSEATNVLFFHADWCPTCRGLENNINANLSQIPQNVVILKLDYDTEIELKKKYQVIRQHTLVVVDGNGNEIKKLTGLTNTLSQVVNQL